MAALKQITRISYKRNPEKGDPGPRGAQPRVRPWEEGMEFFCGAEGELYDDRAYYGRLYYHCLKSHKSTSANNPYASVQAKDGVWEVDSSFRFMATSVGFVGEVADGWIIDNGVITHTSGKLSLTKEGTIVSSNGKFKVDAEGNLYAESGTFAGFLKVNFTSFTAGAKKISNGVYEVSDNFNLIANGGYGYVVTLRLPSAAKFSGCVLNVYDIPIKTRSSTTLSITGTMYWDGRVSDLAGLGTTTKMTLPRGGFVQFIGVPEGDLTVWVVTSLRAAGVETEGSGKVV